MNAAALIAEAASAGVTLYRVDDNRLKWRCMGAPPPDLLERIRADKQAVLAALAAEADAECERWRYLFEERAGILEFGGGLSRAEAEARARELLFAQWLDQHPLAPNHPDGPCAYCAHPMGEDAAVPVLSFPGRRAWLHRRCWEPMNEFRQREAEQAVRALLGITPCAPEIPPERRP